MEFLGQLEPRSNLLDIGLRGLAALLGFLLEDVKDVDRILETNRIDCPVGIAVEVIAKLQNSAAETFQRLRTPRMQPKLYLEERLAELLPDLVGESLQVPAACGAT